jgi:hypothetical protein
VARYFFDFFGAVPLALDDVGEEFDSLQSISAAAAKALAQMAADELKGRD